MDYRRVCCMGESLRPHIFVMSFLRRASVPVAFNSVILRSSSPLVLQRVPLAADPTIVGHFEYSKRLVRRYNHYEF